MKINCLECNTEFEARRNDAKFCSNLCRAKNSNAARRVAQTTTVIRGTMPQAPMVIPSQPIALPTHISQDKREDYLLLRIKQLEAEKAALEQSVNDYRLQDAIRANQPEEKKGFLGFGSVKELAEHPLASKLIEQGAPKIIGLIENLFGSGQNAEGNIFNGIDPEHKDNLHAVVEILKTMPPEVTEVFLGIAGKASDNPDMFLQGFRMGQQKGQPEETTENPNHWTP